MYTLLELYAERSDSVTNNLNNSYDKSDLV